MKRRGQRGIALVLVTWVFMILGVLAFDFARYMRDDAVAALNLAEETRNYYVAVAGMNRAIYDLEHADEFSEGGVGTPGGRSGVGGGGSGNPPGTPGGRMQGGTPGGGMQRGTPGGGMPRSGFQRGAMLTPGHAASVATCAGKSCKREDDDDDDGDDGDKGSDGGSDDADDADDEDEGLSAADGEWHEEELSGARYGVRVTDEGGLISLNDAAREGGAVLLRHVVKNLLGFGGAAGMDRHGEAAIGTVVDSIVDWADANDEEGVHGAESRFYLDREPSYPAKNSDFDSIEELLLVRGVTPELFYGTEGVPGLKDIFTPYVKTQNGQHPKINIRRAPAAVLQALLNIDAEEAAQLIEDREEQDPVAFEAQVLGQLRTLDPTLGENLFGAGSAKIVRVEARADVSVPRNQARVAAVVEITSELTESPRIIRWFDRAPWSGGLPAGTGDRPA
jgi:type II secretory pathway component PulK